MVSPTGTWGPPPMGLSECPADVHQKPPPAPRKEQSTVDNLLSTLAHRQGYNSTPKGMGPQAAAQFLRLTPLPLRTLGISDLKPLIPRVGTMTLETPPLSFCVPGTGLGHGKALWTRP